jgi:hypothetical protein
MSYIWLAFTKDKQVIHISNAAEYGTTMEDWSIVTGTQCGIRIHHEIVKDFGYVKPLPDVGWMPGDSDWYFVTAWQGRPCIDCVIKLVEAYA